MVISIYDVVRIK